MYVLCKNSVTLKVKAVQWEMKWMCTTEITHKACKTSMDQLCEG